MAILCNCSLDINSLFEVKLDTLLNYFLNLFQEL